MQHFEPMMMIHVCRTLMLLEGFVNRKRTFDTFPLKILLSLCWMYKISESSVELFSLLLNMFDFGEGPTTRTSIRGAKSDAFSTPMKYITRAVLHRASESKETKPDVLGSLPKLAKPKEDNSKNVGRSRSSSAFSEQEKKIVNYV